MDFVVVGLGIGAFAVLLGLAIRDLGPFFRRIPRDGSMLWSEVAQRVAWGRRCRAAGLVLAIVGAALCLITGIALLARVSDSNGMWAVLGTLGVAAVATAFWAFRYRAHERAPSVPSLLEEATEERVTPQRPTRKSALDGIRSSRPNVGRRPADPEPAEASAGERPDRRPADVAPPMGALTVDASGAMRRTQINVQPEQASPTPRPQRPAPSSTPDPTRSQRGAGPRRDSR